MNEPTLQPCSPGCAGFRDLKADPWCDYGLCERRNSPWHGFPVRIGTECAQFTPQGAERLPARAPHQSARDSASSPRH